MISTKDSIEKFFEKEELGLNTYICNTHKWDSRLMNLAKEVAKWSSCERPGRHVGAVIAKEGKRIIATGYNGAPIGFKTCSERGGCLREQHSIPSGQNAELCYATHAEQNALIQAARLGISVEGATLYCTHQPCAICTKLIINAGVSCVVYDEPYPDKFRDSLVNEAKSVQFVQFKED